MSIIYFIIWAFSQLFSYGVAPWLLFVGIALFAARFGHIPGMIAGHVAVAVAVMVFDVRWVQAEMQRPGWNGVPDLDMVFRVGVLIRAVLINTVLLPVSFMGLRRFGRAMDSQD